MSQEAYNNGIPSGVGEVAFCVERLIRETNEDLKNFREEQAHLRAQLSGVVNENRNLHRELAKCRDTICSGSHEDMQQRLHLTSDALTKALAQVQALKKERRSLQTMQECSQRTINNMETELKGYREELPLGNNEQIKCTKTIKMMETKLAAQQEELHTQAKVVKALHEHKQRCGEQIEHLQSRLKERQYNTTVLEDNQDKILSLRKQLKEYEKSLKHTRTLLDDSTKREVLAMRKVQEALTISEAAVREKNDAEKRAQSFKEEATQLATNIGTIMEEAAKRVDNEVNQLKEKLSEKHKTIASLRENLKTKTVEHKAAVQALEARILSLTQNYNEALQRNEEMEAHVEGCNKRLQELEDCSFKHEAHHLKSKKSYESQMENYLIAYKELKAHYKEVLSDLTQKFEIEFDKIHKERAELLAENELLRSKAAGDGFGNLV